MHLTTYLWLIDPVFVLRDRFNVFPWQTLAVGLLPVVVQFGRQYPKSAPQVHFQNWCGANDKRILWSQLEPIVAAMGDGLDRVLVKVLYLPDIVNAINKSLRWQVLGKRLNRHRS